MSPLTKPPGTGSICGVLEATGDWLNLRSPRSNRGLAQFAESSEQIVPVPFCGPGLTYSSPGSLPSAGMGPNEHGRPEVARAQCGSRSRSSWRGRTPHLPPGVRIACGLAQPSKLRSNSRVAQIADAGHLNRHRRSTSPPAKNQSLNEIGTYVYYTHADLCQWQLFDNLEGYHFARVCVRATDASSSRGERWRIRRRCARSASSDKICANALTTLAVGPTAFCPLVSPYGK
jgi:hypothetical protein